MSFLDMFVSKPAAAAKAADPNASATLQQQQNNNQNPGTGGTPPNPDSQSATPNSGTQKAVDPMDAYSKMWDTPKDGDKAPTFTLDSKVLGDIASKQDFMAGINPELVKKAQAGDTESLLSLMNHVGQNAYRNALEHTSTLTDKFVTAREGHNEKAFSSKVRKELTGQALADTPNYSHPVVRKQLSQIADQLQAQHPDAAPAEIAKMAKAYLQELSEAIATPKKANKKAGAVGATNWDEFIDADESSSSSDD